MSGAGIMLMTGDVPRGSLCSSNDVSALIEDLQFTLGEGPCIDAYQLDRPVLEPDLADPDTARWLAFSPPAAAGRRPRRVRISGAGRRRRGWVRSTSTATGRARSPTISTPTRW